MAMMAMTTNNSISVNPSDGGTWRASSGTRLGVSAAE